MLLIAAIGLITQAGSLYFLTARNLNDLAIQVAPLAAVSRVAAPK